MGGQACVLYGAAEFSRDTDLAILGTAANLSRLRKLLSELQAEVIAVPPFELQYLRKGHSIHFRCGHSDCFGLRIDVMTRMRGVDDFSKLWRRRTTIQFKDGTVSEVMGLADLVRAKKTQREKDWPMIQRLVERHYFAKLRNAQLRDFRFWFSELRTPELLVQLAQIQPKLCRQLSARRPLLRFALKTDASSLERALSTEKAIEQETDRRYWQPLKAELERLRHKRVRALGR
jgi:hypothetical protein